MYRLPGRKLTEAEAIEINGTGEPLAVRLRRIAAEKREARLRDALQEALDRIEECADSGAWYCEFSTSARSDLYISKATRKQLQALGFKVKKRWTSEQLWVPL